MSRLGKGSEPDRPSAPMKRRVGVSADWAGPASIVLLFAAMLWWTWLKWPDPIVDFGLQMYRGWQLAEGRVLYRDISLPFGPLSQYLVAGWFKVAGVSLRSMIGLNLLVLVLILFMVHRLVHVIAGRAAAAAGGLVFVGVFAFAQYAEIGNYNYVTPYTEEATHGMAVSLAAILLVGGYGRTAKRAYVGALGACLGLLFLIKPEFFAAALAGTAAGLGAILWGRGARRRDWTSNGVILAAAACIPVAAAWAWLAVSLGPSEALRSTAKAWSSIVQTGLTGGWLYQTVFGFDSPGLSAAKFLTVLGCHALVLAPIMAAARRCRPGPRGAWLGLGMGTAAAVLLWLALPDLKWLDAVRPFPLEIALIAGWALRGAVGVPSSGGDPALWGMRLAVAVFSLALLAKMVLNTHVFHYGFVLAMPAAMLAVCALVSWLPSWLDRVGGSGVLLRCAACSLLAVFILAHWRIQSTAMSAKIHQVGSGPDRFLADSRGRYLNDAVGAILSLTPPLAKVFVVPEGAFVNYLSRRRNPGPLHGFLPNDLTDEGSVIRMLQTEFPEAIVITNRSVEEFGTAPFGYGYGRRVLAWIDRYYTPARQFGPTPFMPGGDGIVVLVPRA